MTNTTTTPDAGLADRVRHFRQARVVVLGDIILDKYVGGSAARLSPEAPIPVLRPSESRTVLGGAANVAANVAALGARAILLGVVGEDGAAAEVTRLARMAEGIDAKVITAPGRPTTVKTRFMSGSHQLLRLDEETTESLNPQMAQAVLAEFEAALEGADIVVISDYAKGVLCDTVLASALAEAATRGVRVIADPKRADFSAYRGATVLTPNEPETRLATGIDALHDIDADRAGRAALEDTGGEAVLVTRSAKGVTLVSRYEPALHLPARAREVADVSGAGDTLVAALAVALGSGASLAEAAFLANVAAGISVSKRGTAQVTSTELLTSLHSEALAATESKVMSWDQARAQANVWRAQGLKVGFANGCFDLIHPGHVRLLSEARANSDRLIVALNTDASVRKLKGSSRPVQNEAARATVMASLSPVDLVVLFDQDTPLELIRHVRPDVLVKGADYKIEQVVGADLVQSWGGRVLLVDLQAGHSTSNTIRRMATVDSPP